MTPPADAPGADAPTPATPRPLTEVAPGVWVATAARWRTTSTLVVDDDGACLVVDPALTPAELRGLVAAVRTRGWSARAGFSTHPHWDHVLWSQDLGEVPRLASPEAVAHLTAALPAVRQEADETAPGHDHRLTGALEPVADLAVALPWGGSAEVRLLPHRAHAPGHVALLLSAAGVLVAGDMLSDVEVPLLDLAAPHPVEEHHAALDLLEDEAAGAQVRVVVPGHGGVGDARELARRLTADRRYLDALDAGREPRDPRLDDPWVRQEHDRQRAALSPGAARPPRG